MREGFHTNREGFLRKYSEKDWRLEKDWRRLLSLRKNHINFLLYGLDTHYEQQRNCMHFLQFWTKKENFVTRFLNFKTFEF